jgi:hypothetical protein
MTFIRSIQVNASCRRRSKPLDFRVLERIQERRPFSGHEIPLDFQIPNGFYLPPLMEPTPDQSIEPGDIDLNAIAGTSQELDFNGICLCYRRYRPAR